MESIGGRTDPSKINLPPDIKGRLQRLLGKAAPELEEPTESGHSSSKSSEAKGGRASRTLGRLQKKIKELPKRVRFASCSDPSSWRSTINILALCSLMAGPMIGAAVGAVVAEVGVIAVALAAEFFTLGISTPALIAALFLALTGAAMLPGALIGGGIGLLLVSPLALLCFDVLTDKRMAKELINKLVQMDKLAEEIGTTEEKLRKTLTGKTQGQVPEWESESRRLNREISRKKEKINSLEKDAKKLLDFLEDKELPTLFEKIEKEYSGEGRSKLRKALALDFMKKEPRAKGLDLIRQLKKSASSEEDLED